MTNNEASGAGLLRFKPVLSLLLADCVSRTSNKPSLPGRPQVGSVVAYGSAGGVEMKPTDLGSSPGLGGGSCPW